MLAYVYEGDAGLRLREWPSPSARPDSAVLRVAACAICGTDLKTRRQGNPRIAAPRVIGHELCGELVSLGANLRGFAAGQRVTVTPAMGCGDCACCRRGRGNLCRDLKTLGFQFDGGFAKYMEVPAAAFQRGNVNPVPEGVSSEEAALAEPIACALNGQEFLQIGPEDAVAIFGAGFIGCLHAELARIRKAGVIVMMDTNKQRAERARRLLPEIVPLDPATDDLEAKVRRLTGKSGADKTIVACSSGQAQADALRITAPGGRVSLFGGLSGQSAGFLDSNLIHYRELSVYGAHASTPAQNRQALELVSSGRLDVRRYVEALYGLEDIDRAFQEAQGGKTLKVIVRPNP